METQAQLLKGSREWNGQGRLLELSLKGVNWPKSKKSDSPFQHHERLCNLLTVATRISTSSPCCCFWLLWQMTGMCRRPCLYTSAWPLWFGLQACNLSHVQFVTANLLWLVDCCHWLLHLLVNTSNSQLIMVKLSDIKISQSKLGLNSSHS